MRRAKGPNGGPCVACVAGKYKAWEGISECTYCGAGKFSSFNGKTNESTCSMCPANSNGPAGSAAVSPCLCNAGYTKMSANALMGCEAGKYKDLPGPGSCSYYARGNFLSLMGAVAGSTCISCPMHLQAPQLQVTVGARLGTTKTQVHARNAADNILASGGPFFFNLAFKLSVVQFT